MSEVTTFPVTRGGSARSRDVAPNSTPEIVRMSTPVRLMTLEQLLAEMEDARPVIVRRVKLRYGDEELGDSLAQTCLIAAWEQWREDPAYFLDHDLAGWATCRAYWRAKDHLNDRARFAPLADEHAADDGDGRVKTPEAYAIATEPDVERHQVWEAVHECLARLPDDQRAVVERHFFDGMTDQEQSDLLFGDDGRSRQARGLSVFRMRHAVLRRMRDLLLERGYDPQLGQVL